MSLLKRTPTALVLLALLFAAVQWAPPVVFFLVIQAVVVLALVEFYNLARRRNLHPHRAAGIAAALLLGASFYFETVPLSLALFGVLFFLGAYFLAYARTLERIMAAPVSMAVTAFGAVYVGFTLNFLYLLRVEKGPLCLYFFFAIIFIGDTGAYLFGVLLGRHRMSPLVSPRKTWEGAAGGLALAGLTAAAAQQLVLTSISLPQAVLCGLVTHAEAQMSDPLESLFKRAAGVKDSSNLLPGHGGFLDRVDSLILAGPAFYFYIAYLWK
jgi:phosphatidate cytidylyltransferase